MAFQRGDVVLVPFPFSDLSTTKVRPVVESKQQIMVKGMHRAQLPVSVVPLVASDEQRRSQAKGR